MVEFIAERFNYAVVIVLMMTGLYVVFSTGNLVKKLVGLSVFQTSVFLLYITVGKVAGGQPPILDLAHGDDAGHGADHAAEPAAAAAAVAHDAPTQGAPAVQHGLTETAAPTPEIADAAGDAVAAPNPAQPADALPQPTGTAPEPAAANAPAVMAPQAPAPAPATIEPAQDAAANAAHGAADAAHGAAEILYSNPLPHVLILTAIVVGVATLAVGLALVVRIREVYGVIEDDDLHRADLVGETRA